MLGRIMGMIFNPSSEWESVSKEDSGVLQLLIKWALPLSCIALIAATIGGGLFTQMMPFKLGLLYGITLFVLYIAALILIAIIANIIAAQFGGQADFGRSLALIVYTSLPMMLASVLYIFSMNSWPTMAVIITIVSLYGLCILYNGISPMTNVAEEKGLVYCIAVGVLCVGFFALIHFVLAKELFTSIVMKLL